MQLRRKGPGRLCNCSEKSRDGYETAGERAGMAMKLQRKGPRTAVQLQRKGPRAGTAMQLQRKGPGRL